MLLITFIIFHLTFNILLIDNQNTVLLLYFFYKSQPPGINLITREAFEQYHVVPVFNNKTGENNL